MSGWLTVCQPKLTTILAGLIICLPITPSLIGLSLLSYINMEKHLEYKNTHYPGTFQFIVKSVEESKIQFTFLVHGDPYL